MKDVMKIEVETDSLVPVVIQMLREDLMRAKAGDYFFDSERDQEEIIAALKCLINWYKY